jgi:hypothetical protein
MSTDTEPAGPSPPGRPRQRRVALLAGGLVALVALVGVVVVPRLLPVHALVHVADPDTFGTPPNRPVGTNVSFGITGLAVRGHTPVHLLSARVVHVPVGLKAVGVAATNTLDRFGGTIGITDDTPASQSNLPLTSLYPVSAVTLKPGETTGWYLIATVKVLRPGNYLVRDVEVTYRVGGRTGVEVYEVQAQVRAAPASP